MLHRVIVNVKHKDSSKLCASSELSTRRTAIEEGRQSTAYDSNTHVLARLGSLQPQPAADAGLLDRGPGSHRRGHHAHASPFRASSHASQPLCRPTLLAMRDPGGHWSRSRAWAQPVKANPNLFRNNLAQP